VIINNNLMIIIKKITKFNKYKALTTPDRSI